MSVAGGLFNAPESAAKLACDCVQVFTKNNNQWAAKPILPEDAQRFVNAVETAKLAATLSHASYLINMGSPDDTLWQKSVDAMIVEVERAGQLQIPWVVVHPGSYTTSTPELGIERVIQGLQQVRKRQSSEAAGILLENTAGQGTNLGWDFQQLAAMLDGCSSPDWLGICLDTCHAFAAGYAIDGISGWKRMLADIDGSFGFDSLKALHLNDSKRPCGSRVDRHEHIGLGHIGEEGFRRVLRSRKMGHLPMYLETPKAAIDGEEGDARNLRVLRELAK